MALTWKTGYSNDSLSTASLPFPHVLMGVASAGYALKVDEPTECELSNKTCPIDQPELVTYQASSIKKVPTRNDITHPAPATGAVMYGVRLDEIIRGTSSVDDTYNCDLPIVLNLSIKHPVNSAISSGMIDALIGRLVSSLSKEDGTSRVSELMRSALKPTAN